jgi:redox-sensitive bicupin YhaK (pirin superfamily)
MNKVATFKIRRAAERGHANHGWLDTHYTFSFADYFDPRHMGFRSLRVINDDTVEPGAGFPTHGHRDMEIITYVLEGALEHKDNMGTGSVIHPGDVQRMSAGRGVLHSEYNPSKSERLHLLQIWILPEKSGLLPSYEQKTFSASEKSGVLRLVASLGGRAGSVTIHQDADMYATRLAGGQSVTHDLHDGRHAWLHVATGSAVVNGERLDAGDGAAVSGPVALTIAAPERAEVLMFDLA